MYPATITNEEINLLPMAQFTGRVLVVDTQQKMEQAEQILAQAEVIGFDTETRPSFTKGHLFRMSLLQLSTENTAVLFRLHSVNLSPAIIDILQSPKIIKVGAAIRDDIKGMQKLQKYKPAGFVDLQSIVGQWGIEGVSVKKMAGIVLGIKVSKAQRLSNWEAQQLTPPQIEYAALDAWVCREIYMRLDNVPKKR